MHRKMPTTTKHQSRSQNGHCETVLFLRCCVSSNGTRIENPNDQIFEANKHFVAKIAEQKVSGAHFCVSCIDRKRTRGASRLTVCTHMMFVCLFGWFGWLCGNFVKYQWQRLQNVAKPNVAERSKLRTLSKHSYEFVLVLFEKWLTATERSTNRIINRMHFKCNEVELRILFFCRFSLVFFLIFLFYLPTFNKSDMISVSVYVRRGKKAHERVNASMACL